MSRLIPLAISLVSLLCTSSLFYAQSDPMKWGKVPKEDLRMTVYEADTSAAAVVLGDFGDLKIIFQQNKIKYLFDHHRRIKILQRSGFGEGDIAIPFHRSERLSHLQVQIYTPDGEEIKLKNKDLFEEEYSENWSAMTFSAPNLTEGTVLEYHYTIESEDFTRLRPWYFQEDIPVRWSEYRLSYPDWFNYVVINQGRSPDIQESNTTQETITFADSDGGFNQVPTPIKHTRYVYENVPALKAEGFITTMDDYYARIRFQLSGIRWPSTNRYDPHLSTWPALAEELMGHERFGQQFTRDKFFKDALKALRSEFETTDTPDETVRRTYQFLAGQMEWDGRYTFTATDDLDECFEKKQGSSGDLNLLLLALLRAQGVEAFPALTSTRSNGKLLPLYPIMDQFNHVLVLAPYNDKYIFLDVGSPFRPLGYPRITALNGQAWLVNEATPQWVEVPALDHTSVMMASMTLDPEGVLNGEIQGSFSGYAGMELRTKMEEAAQGANGDDAPTDIEEEEKGSGNSLTDRYPEIEIENVTYEAAETPNEPLKMTMQCRIPEAAVTAGDFLYLSPVLMPAFSENPFKLTERKYPVDIPYRINDKFVMQLSIPEGYTLEEVPESARMVLPDNGGSFQYTVHAFQDKVTIVTEVKIDQLRYEPAQYPALKQFLDLIMEKQESQLVLRKRT